MCNNLCKIAFAMLFMFLTINIAVADDFDKAAEALSRNDFDTALRLWRPLAEKGEKRAQSKLGTMYSKGLGVDQDFKEAIKWYRLAVDQGYADAQYNLGYLYLKGKGVSQDYKEAVELFLAAANQNHQAAQYNIGRLLLEAQREEEAEKWFRLAATQGFKEAQNDLGNLFSTEKVLKKITKKQQIGINWLLSKGMHHLNMH
ncbi:tetratricopeptide repeat protein [Methylomonas sp. CM2]|uniref:tetratricopeptide repeat protein n=1 Tax=Methylomonas sp. CM2 TaxID=3417647 RepID=UPI003CEA782C